jgi:hypothetical protein
LLLHLNGCEPGSDLREPIYSDDPKIIVGGASVKAEIIEAESELQAVKEKIESIDALLNKAIEQL